MSNFLADVGRSNILGQVSQTISAIDSMKKTESVMALGKEQVERLQRQNQAEKEAYELGEQPVAIESFEVLGGREGKMFQDIYGLAKQHGFVDMSAGGLGTIKKRYLPEMKALMSEPRFATKLSLGTIEHYRNNLSQIETQLAQKPGDQKLLQAKQQAITGLNTAMGQNKGLQDELKRQAAEQLKKKWVPTTREEALGFERAKQALKEPKTPSPVTWTTASKNVSNRFGKQDPMGNIIVTPELQGMNRIAQKKLVELKRTGVEPLKAVNMAEDFARNIENRYWEYMDVAKNPNDITKIKSQFESSYGYIPKRKSMR